MLHGPLGAAQVDAFTQRIRAQHLKNQPPEISQGCQSMNDFEPKSGDFVLHGSDERFDKYFVRPPAKPAREAEMGRALFPEGNSALFGFARCYAASRTLGKNWLKSINSNAQPAC